MAEKNFKITGGLALGDYALTANGVSLLWDSNALATQAYVATQLSGVSVNTNAVASSLASETLFVNSGDNLNVNVNALVGELDGTGLYVSSNQLAVNTNVIATKDYVDSVAQGLDVKESVRYATTEELVGTYSSGNNTFTMTTGGITSIDGQAANPNDRVLIKNQSATGQNGIYTVTTAGADDGRGTVTATVFTRAADALALDAGAFTFVEVGSVNAAKGFVYNSDAGTWSQFSEAGSLTAGSNIYLSSGSINVNVNALVGDLDGEGLYVTGNQLAVNAAVVADLLDGTGLYVSGNTLVVNTNAVASSLASATLFVDSGDNLNVNVAAIVGDLDGSGLYVSSNQLAVNVNAFVNDIDGSGLYVSGNQLAVNTNVVATLTDTQTLSNKTLSSPTIQIGSTTYLTPNTNIDTNNGPYDITFKTTTSSTANQYVGQTFVVTGTAFAGNYVVATSSYSFGRLYLTFSNWTYAPEDNITDFTGITLGFGVSTTVSSTEISYLDGVTSNIQTQLDGLALNTNAIASSLASSTLYVDSGDNLNVNVNAFVDTIDGSGLYVTGNQLVVNTNAVASSLASATLFVDSGDNLNVNVAAIVGDLDGSGLYVSSNQLAVNVNAFVNDIDGSGLYVTDNQLAVNTNVIATKSYVDSVAQGLDVKASVVAATSGAVSLASGLENGDTLDGITLATGNRILVKDQNDYAENGIYVVEASGAPTRAVDANELGTDLTSGAFTFVESGANNAGKGFVATVVSGGQGGTTVTWSQFSEAGSLTAGSNIYLSSGSINVNVNALVGDLDGAGLYVSSNQLAVNVNALAGSGLVGSGSSIIVDQYAAGIRYDGASGSTYNKSVITDTHYAFVATSDTYVTVVDSIGDNRGFTFDILMKNNAGNFRKSTVSGFVDGSGNVEYTEYAIVDSSTALSSPDVIVQRVSEDNTRLRVKATFGGMDQISTVVGSTIIG